MAWPSLCSAAVGLTAALMHTPWSQGWQMRCIACYVEWLASTCTDGDGTRQQVFENEEQRERQQSFEDLGQRR